MPISDRARELQVRARRLIPGGSHTYAKGDDQYPESAPPLVVRGSGSHVWDVDGREYIEYGMGLRAVVLGHAHPEVVDAACAAMRDGTNFCRPSPLEGDCAEALLELVPGADMVKFAKNGSDVTTAAVKLARAWTGRDLVAICTDQPFFSTDDWFIGTTSMSAGIPASVRELTVGFHYNDLDGVRALFDRHAGAVACVILEAATDEEPEAGFLEGLRDLCTERGVVLIFDEMITGVRWGLGGAQGVYGVTPDLSAWGKGIGNGFAIAALAGRRDIMELGGIQRGPRERVFLLSTTHGAETHALAATLATLAVCRREDVPGALRERGEQLRAAVRGVVAARGLTGYVDVVGHPANLVYVTRGPDGRPSQEFRALFMQELIRGGVIGPSFVLSHAHSEEDVARTVDVVAAALDVYGPALEEGVGPYLVGGPTRRVFG
jgi:glutamate-1-semialdehyde 2,1-aminomutase